ncbi:MAG: septation protein A [Gammaproteobacteria bacterium]|nr:septation protein A [Gammaproteobacteria bacterium]
MKFLVDFFPVLAFFIAFYAAPDREQAIYVATAAAIIASAMQISGIWLVRRRVEKMHIITFALILVLGGATLLLQDKTFIKWKPTAVNWLFAVVFLASQFMGGKPLVQRMLEQAVQLPRMIWLRLNLSWVAFFFIMGIANLYVAFNFSDEIWVNFKLWGILGLTFMFVIAQSFFLARHMEQPGKGE